MSEQIKEDGNRECEIKIMNEPLTTRLPLKDINDWDGLSADSGPASCCYYLPSRTSGPGQHSRRPEAHQLLSGPKVPDPSSNG